MARYLLLVFILISAFTQQAVARTGRISGRVINTSGLPVPLATVLLASGPDSTLLRTELTNEKGEYTITPTQEGQLWLKAISTGYAPAPFKPVASSNTDVVLPDIMLDLIATELSTVAIRAQKPLVEVHPDKLVVNVENSLVSTGGTVMDVIARSPGVTVDNNDNISLKGKAGVTIMMNGKIQPLSGEELANLLKSMPAGSVEHIELISNPSARYDAAGTAGIINIKTRREKKPGLNGSVTAQHSQGIYGKSGAGINLNYRNNHLNIFASYNWGDRLGFNHLTLDRRFYKQGASAGAYLQDNHYLYRIFANTANLGADYSLSRHTTIGIATSLDNTTFIRSGYNYSRILDSLTDVQQMHFITTNSAPHTWRNNTYNLNLRHSFDSAGTTLSADADYATYLGNSKQHYNTNYFADAVGVALPDASALSGIFDGLTTIRSLKADFTTPLAAGKLELGAKSSWVTSIHQLRFYNILNTGPSLDLRRTNNFHYNELINAAYTSYSKEYARFSMQVGLRIEHTLADGKATSPLADSSFTRRYAQLFPSWSLQHQLNSKHDIGLSLSRRIERPTYDQLNPAAYYLDPTFYKAGDPYIRPALSYSLELSHIYQHKLITTLYASRTAWPIVEVLQPSPTEHRTTIQTQKNLIASFNYGISGSYQLQPATWWQFTTNINIYYVRYQGNIAATSLNDGRFTFDVNTTNSILLPHNWSAEVGGFYQAPQLYGYMSLRPVWMLNAGLQKNFWNKRATARLNITDVFWRGFPRGTSHYLHYTESFHARRDTRTATIAFTYRFGQRIVNPQPRRSGAQDEQRRAAKQSA